MKVPIILQDINSKFIPKEIIVTTPTFFIKSYSRFSLMIQDEYEIDFINGAVSKLENTDKIFDTPYIYSSVDNVVRKDTFIKPEEANFCYTLFLGKTEKTIKFNVYNIFSENYLDDYQVLTIHYKPNNVLLESQEHYNDLLVNNDLPSLDRLLPAIIKKENEYDLIRKLLLDFKQIKKHRGKLKSIEKFLNFIGFDPDSIKLYPEYLTPTGIKTITPNKLKDVKTGFYHVLYDNWIINDDDKYTRKNLPKAIIQIRDVEELFEKLYYALTIANDYFTIPEQQMSFFGMSNMSNAQRFLSVTGNMTKVYYINTLSNFNDLNINIYGRTLIDSLPYYIVKNKVQKNNNIKLSEVKVYTGNTPKQNNQIFFVEKDLSDNYNDTNLTDEEELKIEYLFGCVLNMEFKSPNNKLKYSIQNVNNGLIQYNSEVFELSNNLLQQKIFIGLFGTYEIKVTTYDYYGNREIYTYILNITDTNLDFKIFNSKLVSDEITNELSQDVESTKYLSEPNMNGSNFLNLELFNSQTNSLLENDLKNYFNIVTNENFKSLWGSERFLMKMLNKNIIMKDLTETVPVKYLDNFLNIISIKKLPLHQYEFSDNLFVKLMEITVDNNTTEEHWFITTKTNSVNLSKYLHTINIINSGNILYDIDKILNNEINPNFEYKSVIIPVNYDFELYLTADETDITNLPLPTINPITINSIFPRLKNIDTDELNQDDDVYSLKLGDIILCKIDERYIVNATDIKWEVFNAFTNELIFESYDYSLKYRITEKTLYNIKLTLLINGEYYVVNKKEIQTSFII